MNQDDTKNMASPDITTAAEAEKENGQWIPVKKIESRAIKDIFLLTM